MQYPSIIIAVDCCLRWSFFGYHGGSLLGCHYELPRDLSWGHIIGAGFLGGIGFTMSIFITLLAFENPEIIRGSKITVLFSSLLAGIVGFLILRRQNTNISNRSPVP